jgi:D-alanyl-D-alanine carboxypeptidase (penicillin-binding protein 5/6)
VAYDSPAPPPAGSRSSTRAARRGRTLLVAAALLLGYALYLGAGLLPSEGARPLHSPRPPSGGGALDAGPSGSPAIAWPRSGQAAFVLGRDRPSASPSQRPAPIASLAKVMTAYLTLERYPLSGEEEGFTITVTAADAEAVAEAAADKQSTVAVQPGEQLTERQLLEALLIPSGNNIASMLAELVAGSDTRFVEQMNAKARALGMRATTYTDPSGFDPGTVSTAAEQLRVLRRAMRFPVFRQIVSMASVTLPVAGTLRNFNPLIEQGYAGKTGSDSAAGGCLAFFTRVTAGGRRLTAAGVVMGQGRGSDTSALLAAAGHAALDLVGPAVRVSGVGALPAPGAPGR